MTTISEKDNIAMLTDADVTAAVASALSDAGCTLEELKAQAAAGSFTTERVRRTWFAISAFIE